MRNPERVVIRGTNWLGDTVLTIPAVRALRGLYPAASLTVIAPRRIADLWENEAAVDHVLAIGRPTPLREKLRLVKALRRGSYDLGIIFPNSFESALWFFLGGVRSRLGYACCGRGMLLDRAVPPPAGGGHQARRYLDLIVTLGDIRRDTVPSIRLPGSAQEWAREALREAGIAEGEPLVAVNPGATYGEAKCWPRERFAELIRLVRSRLGAGVVVVGAGGEREEAEELCSEAGAKSLAGKTSIMELAAVLARCDVVVTNDTGPMHVASAVGTPAVAIFGPTDPEETGPLGRSVIVRKKADCAPCLKRTCPTDHRCMRSILAEEAYAAVEMLMDRRAGLPK